MEVSCRLKKTCRGVVTLKSGSKVVARKTVRIPAGRTVVVRLTPKVQASISAKRRKARLKVSTTRGLRAKRG